MPERRVERGPRGKYARLICRGCRLRKIKCVLPDPDDIGPLGIPQVAEKSCERCRSYGMECIIERTALGRPAAKRVRRMDSQANDPAIPTDPKSRDDGIVHTPPLEIRGYIYSEASGDGSVSREEREPYESKLPSKQDVFRSMIEPAYLFSSILAENSTFGASITHATSRWNTPLPDLIDNDMAASLDECLVWHRFFLLQAPTIVSIRHRLNTDEMASTNSATNLLFALLCLIALEISESLSRQHPQLLRSIQIAVSTYGQAFIFSPPTHQDSVIVSLLLSDYKPTALVSSQSVSHLAVKSELYISLAYRIAERLELLPAQASLNLSELEAADAFELDSCLLHSLQALQIHCYDAFLNGFIVKPLQDIRKVLSRIEPHIRIYQSVLECRRCSPKIVYHTQYMTATYILMEAVVDMKQSWNSLESLSMIIEEAERKCLGQLKFSNCFLAEASKDAKQNELSAVRSLLEMRFHSVFLFVCGLGILYAMVMRARFEGGKAGENSEISCQEAVQLGTQVIDSFKNIPSVGALSVSRFLDRFGTPYPNQLEAVLEKFIECTESLRLDGVAFRPPPRHLVLEIVCLCKNIIENNVIQLKGFGRLHPDFDKQLELFAKCAQRLEAMGASPWSSTDAAFAGGCVYAASSKIMYGLHNLMENLKTRMPTGDDGQKRSGILEMPMDANAFDELELEIASEGLELWPFVGGFDLSEILQDQSDWSSALSLFPEFEPTSNYTQEWSMDESLGI